MKKSLFAAAVSLAIVAPNTASAEDYVIDTKGAHASIQFKIAHLGYSWLYGRFNTFSGEFSYDEKDPSSASVSVEIDTASVDSNHAERDKHLRSGDFLHVSEYPKAKFVSTGFTAGGEDSGVMKGDLTLRGVTRPVTIDVTHVGTGKDPWGGYRRGFSGSTRLALKDYGIDFNLGPASTEVELILNVEGIRK
jgi:polyisoprenoid-binding protein YceI